MTNRWGVMALWAACFALALPAAGADRVTGLPSKVNAPLAAYSGEVVVRIGNGMMVAALDELGPDGKAGGQVDQFFYMYSLSLGDSLSLWDTEGKLEVYEDGLRVILHQHGQVLDFSFGTTSPSRPSSYAAYRVQSFSETFQLFRYSGAVVDGLLLLDIDRWRMADLRPVVKSIVPPFLPSPGPDDESGGCALTCTKSCVGGSCSSICNRGFCAQCTCEGNPAVLPACGCVLKQ